MVNHWSYLLSDLYSVNNIHLKKVLNQPLTAAINYFVSDDIIERGETEGDSYTPMLNDGITVTPEFLGEDINV